MKLCIPSCGSRLRLIKDFKVEIEEDYKFNVLLQFKDCPHKLEEYRDYTGHLIMSRRIQPGNLTLPAGTVLKIQDISMPSRRKMKSGYNEWVEFSIHLCALERENTYSKNGSFSCLGSFSLTSDQFNQIEFEFDI